MSAFPLAVSSEQPWGQPWRTPDPARPATLWFLVIERLSLQTRRAICDLLMLTRTGIPVQALHVDTDAEDTRVLHAQWPEATKGGPLPLAVLPSDRGDDAAGTVAAYVRGVLAVDARLRVHLVTVGRRRRSLSLRTGVRPTNNLSRQLRSAFRGEQRVVLTDYCEVPEA